ncbi:MAG: hypothetical protein JST59_15965 [Actinobacteria bacterium]|nr:hypothetical protein [Actinomycetota bacterium]
MSRVSGEDACAVCGRTFLVGEQVHSYVSREGRHEVCSLCAERAADFGWLPADQEGAEEVLRAESERKPGFFSRFFARAEPDEVDEDRVEEAPPTPDPAPRRAVHEL